MSHGEGGPAPTSLDSTESIFSNGTTVGEIEIMKRAENDPPLLNRITNETADTTLSGGQKQYDLEFSDDEVSIKSVSLRSGRKAVRIVDGDIDGSMQSNANKSLASSIHSRDEDGETTVHSNDTSIDITSPTTRNPKGRLNRGNMYTINMAGNTSGPSGHSRSDEFTPSGHRRVKSNFQRGARRGSLGAYKVPHANKPNGGGGFFTVKRRYQPKTGATVGRVPVPRRYSSEGYHLNPSQVEPVEGSSSMDFVPPPPTLDMSQSMALAIAELKAQDAKDKEERRNRKEPKTWLYMTALFILVFATGGLMLIVLLVFGAAFGDVYAETRAELESLTDLNDLEDTSSPQFAALEWLVKKNGHDELDLVEDVKRRETRYGLAVLFYATAGENHWDEKLNFLSGEHECDWNKIITEVSENGEETARTVGVKCDAEQTVVHVSIAGNGLRGQLPSELSALSDLVLLDLEDNELTGSIPDLNWNGLESLYLQNNELEGSIPTSLWSQLPYLSVLDLSSNQLSSSLPIEMTQLSSIEMLNLGFNQLTGRIASEPSTIGEDGNNIALIMPTLRTLNVTNNKLRGTLDFVESFPSLETLDVTGNDFAGRLPGGLGGLTNLEELHLSDNEFFGSFPTSIGSLTNLTKLVASNNEFSRQFPWDSFDEDNQLAEVVLSDNRMTGSLPENMGNFAALEAIDFGRNLLSGTIPSAVSNNTKLASLRLSRNQLTGELPPEMASLSGSLQFVDLHSNQLAGKLPPELAFLDSLSVLTLHDNQFEGPIPLEWIQLTSLARMTLHVNRLVGSIDFLCDLDPQPAMTANCAGEQPQVQCSCCTLCLE